MKSGLALTSSAVANIALAVAALHLLRPPALPTAPHPDSSSLRTELVRVTTNLPPETSFVTNGFHWRQLESTNYDDYVANLRAAGCPDRTIRDIIVADVWDRYEAAKQREDYPSSYWLNGPRRVAAERAREAGLLQLRKELAGLVHRLLAVSWSPEVQRDAFGEGQLLCRVLLGDISEEQFQRAVGLLGRVEEAKDEVRWHVRDILLDEDYAELMRRRDEIERDLRAILSPAQFEEFRARVGAAERLIGHLFSGDSLEEVKPTAGELRQIALAQTEVWPLGWEMLDLDDAETEAQKEAREKIMDTRLRAILGEDRFTEALLLRDGNYRTIHHFAEENQVPKATAHTLYDIQQLAREEVRRVRDDKSLATDARSERLEAVTMTIVPQVSELLGPKVFASYLQQAGQWVTNVNRL